MENVTQALRVVPVHIPFVGKIVHKMHALGRMFFWSVVAKPIYKDFV